ncbi:MAG: di-trans,poly-cis-decaprenylcistransferase [Magnetovibrio sp.]|nr:di-trans,poly-cis-decaprenylcistransferase [Magnetovibrio sp.]
MISSSKQLCTQDEQGRAELFHVAIIMDGNGRWAKARGLPRTIGHQKGADAVRRSVEGAISHGIKYLTLFGFSSENWNRPAEEVKDLMRLLRLYLKQEIKELDKQKVRLNVIGDRQKLDNDIVVLINEAEQQTKKNTRLILTIALSYGSRAEITRAIRQIAEQAANGQLSPSEISENLISDHLYTENIPDPDLLIRTGGEKRISNFLLWQLAYTEFVFIDNHWPDFSEDDLVHSLKLFQARDRRYGTTRN